MVKLKGTLQNKSCLRHGALCRVNQQKYAVYHFEDTFNLAGKVCVPWGVDYVNFNVVIMNRGVFCKYRNTALALKVAGVHNSVFGCLIFTVNAALLQHFVNESGLSVVNVSDYCNIS